MPYYIITDNGIIAGKTLSQVSKRTHAKFDNAEMVSLGSDKVVKVTNKDLDFVQDKKRLSLIPISNLYKSDNTMKYLTIVILVINLILLIKK